MRKVRRRDNKKLEHYCYLRYLKAKTVEAELFWINMHLKIGESIYASRNYNTN